MELSYVDFEQNNGQIVPIIQGFNHVDQFEQLVDDMYREKINEIIPAEDDGQEAFECFKDAFYECKNANISFNGIHETSLRNMGNTCIVESGSDDGLYISCSFRSEIIDDLLGFEELFESMSVNLEEFKAEFSFSNSNSKVADFLSELRERDRLPFDLSEYISNHEVYTFMGYLPKNEIFCDIVQRN